MAGLALLSFVTASTPYPLYGVLLAITGTGIGLAMAPLSGLMVHALPPTHAGVGSGLNSTTRELGSALGVAVLSTILATRFARRLPAPLRHLPGAPGQAVRHSITTALQYAAQTSSGAARACLVGGIHDAHQHPKK